MKRIEIINKIIKMQENCKAFVQVAKKEELEELTNSELTIIYNATFNISKGDK